MQTVENNTRTQNDNGANANNNYRAATDTIRSAFETGVRFQQDAVKSISDFAKVESVEDFNKKTQEVAVESINMIRKNAEQAQEMIDENCKAGIDMLKKSFNMFDTNAKNRDSFAQTREIWNSAFTTMKTNVDAAARMGTQAIESWTNMFNNCAATSCSTDKKNVTR
jgi:hypothetical protein